MSCSRSSDLVRVGTSLETKARYCHAVAGHADDGAIISLSALVKPCSAEVTVSSGVGQGSITRCKCHSIVSDMRPACVDGRNIS